ATVGTCVRICAISPTCPAGDCWIPNHFCFSGCDPVNPSAMCPSGFGCAWLDFADPAHTECMQAGTGKGSGACSTSIYACAPGYTCFQPGDVLAGTCLKICRKASPNCATNETCLDFGTPISGYGYCG